MKNVITLVKVIVSVLLLLLFLKTPISSVNVHTKNTRNELARLVMGTVFLVESERA